MPTLIDAGLRALLVMLDTQIMQTYQDTVLTWEGVAVKKTQTMTSGRYAWMNDLPLIGRKQANGYIRTGVQTQSFLLTSEEMGLFIEIKKQELRDALASKDFGALIDIAKSLGQRMARFPQDLVWNWFKNGHNTTYLGRANLAYDGLSFFNDAHYVNGRNTAGGTYDNNLTGTTFSAANLAAAEAALALLPDNRGVALNQPMTDVIVPPQLGVAAAEVLQARTLSTGGENMQSDEGRARRGLPPLRLWVVPELGSASTTWYVSSRSNGKAPVIWQETEALHQVNLTDERDPNVLYDNLYIFAAKGESVAGWGDPRTTLRLIA